MPNEHTFQITTNEEWENSLTQRLIAHNRKFAPLWEENYDGQFAPDSLHLFAVDTGGEVIGGLIGRTHHLRLWFEISILWVDEDYRRRGLGTELMTRAEEEARRRGCRYARLSTSLHQAPAFYETLGYVLYGKLEDCPPGDTALYYRKDLPLLPAENFG